jgi:hypothetical protein
MFVVLAGFGISRRWGGQRREPALRRFRRIPKRALWFGGAAAIAAYGVLYVTSVHSLSRSSWEPRISKPYIHTFLSDVRAVKAATGREPNLIDLTVPPTLMLANFAPFNQYSLFFPVVDSHLQYNGPSSPRFVVGPTGALERVRFASLATGTLRKARLIDKAGLRPPLVRSGAACVPAGAPEQLRVPLLKSVRLPATANGVANAIAIRYVLPARVGVTVLDAGAGGIPAPVDADSHLWGPGAGTGYALVTTPSTASEVDLDLPGGACIDALTVGAFEPVR